MAIIVWHPIDNSVVILVAVTHVLILIAVNLPVFPPQVYCSFTKN